jgi:hypothetical protein
MDHLSKWRRRLSFNSSLLEWSMLVAEDSSETYNQDNDCRFMTFDLITLYIVVISKVGGLKIAWTRSGTVFPPDTRLCHRSSQPWGLGPRGGVRTGLCGPYTSTTMRGVLISYAIVWSTTSLGQEFNLGFTFCTIWGDFCYKLTSGCLDCVYHHTMLS